VGGGVGTSVRRMEDGPLLRGRGRFVDDRRPARLLHLAFVRSPYAAARILAVDTAAARSLPGVAAVLTGADVAGLVEPWKGLLGHYQGMKSGSQLPLAVDRARFAGEPVVAVAAASRSLAEDACDLVEVEW